MRSVHLDKLEPGMLAYVRQAGKLAAEKGFRAYIVGGAVRDLLLHRHCLDMDIVVEGDGVVLARLWAARNKADLLVHARFGTAVVTMPDGVKFDVVTARNEGYRSPGALPDVRPGSLAEDLFRRDFTINALAVSIGPDSFGDLHDPLDGRADLRKGLVRIMHANSFKDDPTRILRAVRYEQRFQFRMAPGTLRALKEAIEARVFQTIVPVRYWNEFRRILEEADPAPALKRLYALGGLCFTGCGAEDVDLVGRVTGEISRSNRMGDIITWRIYCAALLLKRCAAGQEGRFLTGFGLSRVDKQKIAEILHFVRLPDMLDTIQETGKNKAVPFEALILAKAAGDV